MDCIVHGVTKSQTWLNDFHTFTLAPNSHCVTFPRSLKSSYAKWEAGLNLCFVVVCGGDGGGDGDVT